jgi:hypothetical protein
MKMSSAVIGSTLIDESQANRASCVQLHMATQALYMMFNTTYYTVYNQNNKPCNSEHDCTAACWAGGQPGPLDAEHAGSS